MAWREIAADGETWKVDTLCERSGGDADAWRLVIAFRASHGDSGTPTVWAPCPSIRGPRATVYAEADRLPDDVLRALLSNHIR